MNIGKNFEKTVAFWKEKLNEKNRIKVLVALGFVGIILICLPEFLSAPKVTDKALAQPVGKQTALDYADMLSQRLEEVLGAIEGVGEIRVMVTLRQEEEFVYAVDHTINDQQQEMTTHHQSEQTHVIVEQNGQEEPLLSTKMAPQVQGVIIVCAGGDNPVVIEKLIQAATAALNISSNRVAVSKLG